MILMMQQARKDLFDLNGKDIVITGGASGLGLGYARGIAKYRGSLSIWDISEHKLKNAKAELESYGVKVTTHLVDVRSEEEIINAYQQVIEQHGRLDCVLPMPVLHRDLDLFWICLPKNI